MGIFDFLKGKPSKDAILAQVRKAKEVYAQPEYRRMAMEKLLKWGDDESIKGLLERFSTVVQSPHWDEDEKRWLTDELIKLKERALPILRDFILEKNDINHALLAYRTIVNNDQTYVAFLKEALLARPPSDHRSVVGKQEIIAQLAEFRDDSLISLLIPYLDDHSDDVQCAAIDTLAPFGHPLAQTKFVSMLGSDSHSARVLRKVAQVVSQHKLPVNSDAKLNEVILEDYKIAAGFLEPLGR